jgi:hypothetical protein
MELLPNCVGRARTLILRVVAAAAGATVATTCTSDASLSARVTVPEDSTAHMTQVPSSLGWT